MIKQTNIGIKREKELLEIKNEELIKLLKEKDKEIERLKKREQECIDHYLVQCKYASEMEGRYITANCIIKEVREEIIKDRKKNYGDLGKKAFYCNKTDKLLEILNKENINEENK